MRLDPSALSILSTVFGMGFLTLAMGGWMAATRLPAMARLGLSLQEAAHTADLGPRLPPGARRVADNLNHLFEVPTLFYAIALAIIAAGIADPIHAVCAWVFLATRVLHSLVQATFNNVTVRMAIFIVSCTALGVMIIRGAFTLWGIG
jgi:hypothetical protein